MFNDIWSLGIILLNLATGRNPWKSATPDDQTFRAYLRDPLGFLPTVLPISPEVNDILARMLEVDWRERMTLRELRRAIEDVHSFYSDGVVFEGSMARCPWESGMDIDSDSSEDTKDHAAASKSEGVDFESHWSKDSNSEIIFAKHYAGSVATEDSSFGVPWTNFSSCGATSSSASRCGRPSTPVSPASSGGPSFPPTPNNIHMLFGNKANPPPRKGLTIETNLAQQARYYNPSASMAVSRSTGTSMMQTAVEYDPYSPSFFFTSAASESKASIDLPISRNASFNDKEMTSPSIWASSATEMSSPSVYSSSGSSDDSGEMSFSRSETPSPNTAWSEYRSQVQCLSLSQPSQPSPSIYAVMTDVIPPSRPSISIFAPRKSHDGSKTKTTSIFNPIKFFPRSAPPTPPPTPPTTSLPNARPSASESASAAAGNQTPHAPPFPTPWASMAPQAQHAAPAIQPASQDQRIAHFRSARHWFMPAKFFAYAGAQ